MPGRYGEATEEEIRDIRAASTPAATPSGPPVRGPHPGGQGTGQSGGAAGSGLVPVTSTVPGGVGGGYETVMVPVNEAPISAGGPGPGIEGISDVQDLFPILGEEEETILPDGADPYIPPKKPEDKKETVFEAAQDWFKKSAFYGVGKGMEALLYKLAHPTKESFQDPKFLAVIDQLFKDKGDKFKKDYVGEYKELMDEAFAGNEAMLAQGLSSEEFFNQQLEEASDLSEMGELGKGSQRINFPKEYYLDDGERGIMPQTTGELENLAGLDASQYAGTDLAQMIFDARAELDRQQGAGGGGGGAGITGLPGIPPDLVQQPATILPPDLSDVVLGYGPGDMAYTAVMPRSGYQYTHDAAGNRYEIPIGGDQSGTTYRGNPFTFREGEPWQAPVGDKLTTAAPATTPTPFDYSQWPQFTSAYPGHYANWGAPSYVNGGIVSQARPQLDYWNRINRTYPGMR